MNKISMPSQLGCLGLGVSDLSAWNDFSQNILGLEVRPEEKDGSLMLRMDEYHHRFILTEDACDTDRLAFTASLNRSTDAFLLIALLPVPKFY
jgi:catechol-2,3-dioxygenase